MSESRWLRASEAWTRALLRLYPEHFREELGGEVLEAYRDRSRDALKRGGVPALLWVWLRALSDSLRNGLGERARPSISWRRLGNWGRDSEVVMRRLRRAPVFTATMIGALTVGLGAFAVVYAVLDKVLLEPLPYENPDDLYWVWRDYGWFDLDRGALAGTDLTTLADAGGPIEAVVGIDRSAATLSTGTGDAEEVGVIASTPELFEVLGAEPALGRGFAASESGPGRPPVAVLTHETWTRRFGASPGVIGSEVRLDGVPYTVIGVMGRDFQFVQNASVGEAQGADVYVTLEEDLSATNPGAGSYAGLLRASPGTQPDAVASAVEQVGEAVDQRDFEGQGLRLYAVGAKSDLVKGVRPALVVLGLAGVILVLVLAVNLATLLLARAAQREREFAISRALGANRMAVVRATLLEGGTLGLLGGVGGALLAIWGTRALVALAPANLPRREAIGVDLSTAALVIATGALLGLVASLVPAVWATRARLSTLLRATAVRGGGGHARMRRGLVVLQVALALMLLSAGGLVVRSFEQLLRENPGFTAEGVLTLRVPVPLERYPTQEDINPLHLRIEQELSRIPGVLSVGAVSSLPLTADANQTTASFPGAPGNTGEADEDAPLVDYFGTRPGYFEAMRILILAGRDFPERPLDTGAEAVIDRTLAQKFFPDSDAVGRTVVLGGDSLTVLGVVEHARQYDVHRDDRSQVFVRNEFMTHASLSWALRTERPPGSLAHEARAAVSRADPQLAVSDVRPMAEVVEASLRQERVSASLIAGFSLCALLLAAMGLYGVVVASVARRRHELAVRMALGAERAQVMRLVVGEGMLLVMLGSLLGIPGVLLAGHIIRGLLVGVSPVDPVTLGVVASALGLVALAACYLPARRVATIEPAGLLRQE